MASLSDYVQLGEIACDHVRGMIYNLYDNRRAQLSRKLDMPYGTITTDREKVSNLLQSKSVQLRVTTLLADLNNNYKEICTEMFSIMEQLHYAFTITYNDLYHNFMHKLARSKVRKILRVKPSCFAPDTVSVSFLSILPDAVLNIILGYTWKFSEFDSHNEHMRIAFGTPFTESRVRRFSCFVDHMNNDVPCFLIELRPEPDFRAKYLESGDRNDEYIELLLRQLFADKTILFRCKRDIRMDYDCRVLCQIEEMGADKRPSHRGTCTVCKKRAQPKMIINVTVNYVPHLHKLWKWLTTEKVYAH